MARKLLVLTAVAAGTGGLVLASGWLTAALVVGTSAVGWGIYQRRVKRGTSREFFGETGEETRLTDLKGPNDQQPPQH